MNLFVWTIADIPKIDPYRLANKEVKKLLKVVFIWEV